MDGDAGLVGYLVDRLATKLPHRVGVNGTRLDDDEVLHTTRTTLVKLSQTTVNVVLDALLDLFEEVSRPYGGGLSRHPVHVLQSESYIVELAAACCSARWAAAHTTEAESQDEEQLKDSLAKRVFDIFKTFLEPNPDDESLPARTLLDNTAGLDASLMGARVSADDGCNSIDGTNSTQMLAEVIEKHVKMLIEFVTAFSWGPSFSYLRAVIHSIRTTITVDAGSDASKTLNPSEKGSLVILRLLSYCWVDSSKLGLLIQEICSSYLHFRRPYQNTVAVSIPFLITRWIDRYPDEFVQLHRLHKRLDGGSDTLFDMTQTAADNGRRRTPLYPLQITLLFLMPDVFEVASNLREAKGTSIIKKVAFLDTLRKALRNGNEQAGYCLVSLLRVARHFNVESDSALVSFAMDVHDEVRDAIFRPSPGTQRIFDQDMVTAGLISLAHLNLEVCLDSLVGYCTSDDAPESFRVALVEACCYFSGLREASSYTPLFNQALPFMKTHMKAVIDSSSDGTTKDVNVDLTCRILRFLASSISCFDDKSPFLEPDGYFLDATLLCVLFPILSIRKNALEVTEKLFLTYTPAQLFTNEGTDQLSVRKQLRCDVWTRSSTFIIQLCKETQTILEPSLITSLHSYLRNRLLLLKKIPLLGTLPSDVPIVSDAVTVLEKSLLVALCSANIETCQLVAASIGILLEERQLVSSSSDNPKAYMSLQRNLSTLGEISSPNYRITGLVAFQKRIRVLFRNLACPTPGILQAWETAFEKWIHLAKDLSTMPADLIEETSMSEWRNLSGFLASIGGICVSNQAASHEDPSLTDLKWIDLPKADNPEEALLHRYLRLSVQLLACSSVRVREAMRDTLSHEMAPQINPLLLKAVESEVEVLLTGALAHPDKAQDSEVIFAEQTASLLKDMVENIGSPQHSITASTVHLGVLSLNFAKFVEGVPDTATSLRVKIRICQLVEAVIRRKEHLILRDDVRIRNQLLEFIFGWIDRPGTPLPEHAALRLDESWRMQKDLDRACLKALADLTMRLPLQPADSQTDASMSEMKAQMFQTYFNRFLSLLNQESLQVTTKELQKASSARDEGSSNADLAISILSNLLSANIDVGLKHSLNIGYHESIAIRTAFIRVLYNILSQGTEFSNLSDSAVTEKYDELLNILTKDMSLAVAMSTVCPGAEIDELAVCLLTVFEQRGQIFDLFEALIREEVNQTENETELLRRTSVATKMLSLYAKWKGYSYLHGTLHKVLDRLLLTSQDLDLELDPTRVGSPEELRKNALQLQVVSKVFMDDICASAANIPPSFRKICSIIHGAVLPRFPNAKYTAVGAFIFLRFFCPAIVAPEAEGLVPSPPSKEMRRGLLLIAKIIQNLANNVLFGTKEPYMFPLNQFLVKNISVVVSFIHEISIPPENLQLVPSKETFDFGSCVSFHRFLYDHWDHLRQTLTARERREYVRSPDSMARTRSPILEPLRSLVANLGPSPLAISWNRPQIAMNGPPLYARFQNFMLRNAFKSTESFLASQAVYDGGETKDGLSILNIILRHIENEGIDYETLLYCYLKIASRLWHEPFVVFVDATCYTGKNEPRDDFFKMLDMLAPVEMSQNLCRIYIYNMNSAFKRCFRRLLRISTKNEYSVFHPSNVEYHLPSNLDDLQIYFNLSHMLLPKDTISVMSDGRFMFQPITRLSKSKGRVEVSVKVGSQFLQITTLKKQEILSGLRLSAVINDVFRLSDVDEAATTMQADDDASFGIRADGGKIVMCFTSTKKAEVLHAIRNAKGKQGKDGRTHKHLERLIRPQDVPGTLLNLAFANLLSVDRGLRVASYNLLGALGRAFQFDTETRLVCTKDLGVPMDPSRFIINISTQLAHAEPQLTSDFLTEFFVSWETFPDEQKALSLAYMAPWLSGLRTNVLVNETDGEKGRDKVAAIFHKFIDLIALDQTLSYALEQSVWPLIVQDEVLLEIFLEELVKAALSFGMQGEVIDTIASIIANISSVTARARSLARLRKALNRSSLRPTRHLPDNAVWSEICSMLHICVALSFDSSVQSQLFLPEIFHVVTMLGNTGTRQVRSMVHMLLTNTVHAICTSFTLDETRLAKVRACLEQLAEPKGSFFAPSSRFSREGSQPVQPNESGSNLAATENLVAILYDICNVAAVSTDMANAWRSRWMSLVASTAFQNNPAIQPRAFAVMGYLARQEVDDDLLYQVLVALRNSVAQFGEDGDSEMLISIITCLSRMMANLPSASRYGLQLFWLAMSLVRLVPASLFNCTAQFLEAILGNIGGAGNARGDGMVTLLLQSRGQLDDAAQMLDDAYGIHFDEDNFHFAVCACLVRGLTNSSTRHAAVRVLCSFLELSSAQEGLNVRSSEALMASPYLALSLARCADFEDLREGIWSAGMDPDEIKTMLGVFGRPEIQAMEDKQLLLVSAIELVDFQYLEDTAQSRSLLWLNELAKSRPSVFLHLCGVMPSILNDVLIHGQDSVALEAAHTLVATLTSEQQYSKAMGSMKQLTGELKELGFSGLWTSSFHRPLQNKSGCFELTEKLIELIVI